VTGDGNQWSWFITAHARSTQKLRKPGAHRPQYDARAHESDANHRSVRCQCATIGRSSGREEARRVKYGDRTVLRMEIARF
jgi:hypothetical protein